jgi:hypothetical protein
MEGGLGGEFGLRLRGGRAGGGRYLGIAAEDGDLNGSGWLDGYSGLKVESRLALWEIPLVVSGCQRRLVLRYLKLPVTDLVLA